MRQDDIERNMDELRQGIKITFSDSLKAARSARGKNAKRVNVASRVNKAVVVNTGEPGSASGVSSKQDVHIVQDGERTYEHSETVKTEL